MTQKRKPARKRLSVECLEDRLCMSAMALNTPLSQPDAATQARVGQAYGQLPLSFEANQGQVDPQVNFLSQGSGYTLFLTSTEAVMSLQQPASNQGTNVPAAPGDVLRMQLVGANPTPAVAGLDEQAAKTNYFVGSDPAQWHTDIANYGKVQYQNVYPGVDLIYYGNPQQLEYDFVLAPGADSQAIRLAFQGAEGIALDSQGDLVLHTGGGDVIEHAPVLYQESNGVRQAVSGHYLLEGNGQVGFQVGAYDPARPLVIDPVYSLVYSTYLGGNKADTAGYGIAVDGAGDAYVTGTTQSIHFPTTAGAFQTSGAFIKVDGGGTFVTKFNAAGSALVYSTYIGAAIPSGIAVDSAGNAYITGNTTEADFPTKNALQATYGGDTSTYGITGDAFVTKLNATGSALVYSTFLGGSGSDKANGIAVDRSGDAYVTGSTNSTNFPTTPGSVQPVIGISLGFVAELNPIGSALVYSTYLSNYGYGIAVDGSGSAYVTGFTVASNTNSWDASVAKLNSTGSAFVYIYRLGGSSDDIGIQIAVDGSGNAYVTGQTDSADFPTTSGAFQKTFGGGIDAFVTELNAAGSALVYSTYLGGSGIEGWVGRPNGGIAVDSSGRIYVTGTTTSTNFPTKNALQATYGGGDSDAFVAELDPSQVGAASLVYSTYLGGSDQDVGYGIAVDGSGNAYVTGFTYSANFPTKNAFQPQINPPTSPHNQFRDAFVTKIDPPADAANASAASYNTSMVSAALAVTGGSAAQVFLVPGVSIGATMSMPSTGGQAPVPATPVTPSQPVYLVAEPGSESLPRATPGLSATPRSHTLLDSVFADFGSGPTDTPSWDVLSPGLI